MQDNAEFRSQLDAAGQPQQAFVATLTEKQQKIKALRSKITGLQEMNQKLVPGKESLNHDVSKYARKQADVTEERRFAGCFLWHDADVPTRDSVDPEPFIITRRDE
jgi:chromosome segregation ATPase